MLQRPAAGLLVVALLALAGCSDDSSSSADPPTTAPTSATSSTTPSETEAPETPEEFVRRWVEVDTKMQNTGKTHEFRSISVGCPPCKGLADQVDDIYTAGGYVKTDGLQILRSKTGAEHAGGDVAVHIWVNSTPTELVVSEGADVQRLPGGNRQYIVTVRQVKGAWNTVLLEGVAQ